MGFRFPLFFLPALGSFPKAEVRGPRLRPVHGRPLMLLLAAGPSRLEGRQRILAPDAIAAAQDEYQQHHHHRRKEDGTYHRHSDGPSLYAPTRRFSVAELERQHRAPGATIEFVAETPRGHRLISPVVALREIHGVDGTTVNTSALQHVNTRRCGYTWDDAAAKCGPPCPRGSNEECSPHEPVDDGSHFWVGSNYSCYDQLPVCDPLKPKGDCYSKSKLLPDAWCMERCGDVNFWCDRDNCVCEDDIPINAPIEVKMEVGDPKKLPKRTMQLREKVMLAEATKPGLPECLWAPGPGCRNTTQYECVAGPDAGKCSPLNWYGKPTCKSSCVHTSLLKPAPYYAVWRPGPVKPPLLEGNPEPLPHYAHNNMNHQLAFTHNFTRGDILMSRICQSKVNEFVGISMYSPKYRDKAKRLINSCERVGCCCKATVLPPNVFGPDAPEGSEEFRFRAIAIKPAFILSQLRTTQLPVVFLDSDLEFHRFPELFQPGSWPNGDRDLVVFNFWANETNLTIRSIPNTASGVMYFNQTFNAQKVLVAWAEAMAYEKNVKAPDDQVLDVLLVNGWLERASYGWLPSSYLRLMPSYYRGVRAVIDHDHGNAPGLVAHSSDKAVLPPVRPLHTAAPHLRPASPDRSSSCAGRSLDWRSCKPLEWGSSAWRPWTAVATTGARTVATTRRASPIPAQPPAQPSFACAIGRASGQWRTPGR